MFCPRCGTEVDVHDRACPNCGEALFDVPGSHPPHEEIPNHMVGAILTALFCCQVGGVIAVVYAAQVNTLLECGKIDAARKASESAKTWITASVVIIGVIFLFGMLASVFR